MFNGQNFDLKNPKDFVCLTKNQIYLKILTFNIINSLKIYNLNILYNLALLSKKLNY